MDRWKFGMTNRNLNGKYNNPPTFHSPSKLDEYLQSISIPRSAPLTSKSGQWLTNCLGGTQVGISCTKFAWNITYKIHTNLYVKSRNLPEMSTVRFLARARYEKDSKQQKTSKGNDVHITQVVIDSPLSQCRMGF